MKILLINTLYPPTVVGGAERSLEVLARGLAERGFEVAVACLTETLDRKEKLEGVTVYRIAHGNVYWPFDERRHSPLKRLRWHLGDAGTSSNQKRLEEGISEFSPDIVHTNNLVGFGAGVIPMLKHAGLPVVHTLRDFGLLCSRSSLFKNLEDCETRCTSCRMLTAGKSRASQGADVVVGNSSFMIQRHRDFGVFADTPAKTIYNAVPGIMDERPKTGQQARAGSLHIGFAGAVKPEKGIEVLLEALRLAGPNGWHLSIAGTGDKGYIRDLEDTYSDLPIDWLGFVPIQPFLDSLDLLVIPSVWPEPMPRTLIEAMAHRLPVIVSDAGGAPEVAEMYEGAQLYPKRDAAALARLLSTAIADRPSTPKPGDEILQNFTVETLVDNYLSAYQEAIAINRSKATQ